MLDKKITYHQKPTEIKTEEKILYVPASVQYNTVTEGSATLKLDSMRNYLSKFGLI